MATATPAIPAMAAATTTVQDRELAITARATAISKIGFARQGDESLRWE
jgi:hypothetical protein